MKIIKSILIASVFACFAATPPLSGAEVTCVDGSKVNPFASNSGHIPPKSAYKGPLFRLSYDYPKKPITPPADPPWRKTLKGKPISSENAGAYVDALKDYLSRDMKVLMYDYPNWDAAKAGWYNSPWVFPAREAIHGTFVGSSFDPGMFPRSGLKTNMTTHVLTYYDKVSAYQLQQVWGTTAEQPNVSATVGQFPEGSIIVKAALTTASGREWPPIEGAQPWPIYAQRMNYNTGSPEGPYVVQPTFFFQFDIIVKDSITAPRTGWVFATLVYDKNIKSNDNWDKMVPLGAMWGNDPTVISPLSMPNEISVDPRLKENWINPAAPLYAKETLGWGGRLSGPNDGAVTPAYYQTSTGQYKYVARAQVSSCMSCHSSAEYKPDSFLLPFVMKAPHKPKTYNDGVHGTQPVIEPPGSPKWMSYFQSRYGTNGMDKGSFGLDYDMMLGFKAYAIWSKCTQPSKSVHPLHKAPDNYRKFRIVNPSK